MKKGCVLYRPGYTREYGLFAQPLTPAVRALLIANLCVFIIRIMVQRQAPGAFDILFGLSEDIYKNGFFWQIFTYMFLHAGIIHILFNMLILYFLGTEIERTLGSRNFLVVYFVSGMLGGLGWLLLTADPGIPCIGASGAVFGLLGAYVALFPQRYITVLVFFILPITLKAWMLATLLAGIEFLLMTARVEDQIAHSAHLAGLLAGYVFAFVVFRKGGFRKGGFRVRIVRDKNPAGLKVLRREDAPLAVSPEEIDRILDKIANEGMTSLSHRERSILEKASTERRT